MNMITIIELEAGQALARAVRSMLDECPFDIDEETIPKAGIDANQVVGRCRMSVGRRKQLLDLAVLIEDAGRI